MIFSLHYPALCGKIGAPNENHSCLDLDTVNTNDNHSQTHFGAAKCE